MTQSAPYRQIAIGSRVPDAVTVGIEAGAEGAHRAAVWWEARGDGDAGAADYADVAEALAAAEAARVLHGFAEVVIVLQDGVAWQAGWGQLAPRSQEKEPLGDMTAAPVSEDEMGALAEHIEAERDA